jgi:hypothetical protein
MAQRRMFDFLAEFSDEAMMDRQRILCEHYLKGDPRTTEITLYLPPNLSEGDVALIVEQWAKETSRALLPHAIKLFPRHRWCTSAKTLVGPTMLALQNNLLRESAPRWQELINAPQVESQKWTQDDDENLQLLVLDQTQVKTEQYWAAFNSRNKKDAISFALDADTPIHLVLFLATFKETCRRFQRMLSEGSVVKEIKELREALDSGSRTYPLL